MLPRRLAFFAVALATVALTVAAAMVMFSAFMFYDDEGYVLTSLKNFSEHGHLYSEIYSQYGPFPYVFYYVLHGLGLPFTHTAGRLVTLCMWSGSAVASVALVGRATRSLAAQLAVLASVFVYLWVMANESTHPGGLIALITAILAYGGHRWLGEHRYRAWAALAGAGAAVLLLTKINIGGFVALAAAGWFLLHQENPSVRRYAPIAAILGVVVLPFALMRPLLDAVWVQTYAILFACSGAAAVGAVAIASTPRVRWRVLADGVLWAAAFGIVVLGVVLLRGSSLTDVMEGVLLRPLRHPVRFNLDFPWPGGVRLVAAISLGLFIVAWIARRRAAKRLDEIIAVARIAAALALAALITRFPAISPDHLLLSFAIPWLWLFLWPLAGEDHSAVAARSWVGLLFLGQCLHGFPVRGSQTAWGTFLALPIAALGAWQGARWLADRHPASQLCRPVARLTLQAAVMVFAVVTGAHLFQVGGRYHDGLDLGLPGAERVRLPENATALFQLLTLNAAAHGDMLFSLPGMFSLNLWSGLPTPTYANATHWFSLLDTGEQQAIIHSLEDHPRACVIVEREHVGYITRHSFAPTGPLTDYIHEHFEPAFSLDNFDFCVRKGRKIAPLLLGEIYNHKIEPPATGPDAENTLLKFTVLLPAGTAIDSVEIRRVEAPASAPIVLHGPETRVEITPINLRGEPLGPAEARPWPIMLKGVAVVSLYFDCAGWLFPPGKTLIILRDAGGNDLALVRLQP